MESSTSKSETRNKPLLRIDIINFKQLRYIYYYTIQLTKIYSGETYLLEKRFKSFSDLNEALKTKNYVELPLFPPKTLIPVRNAEHLERRRVELNTYMK